MGLEKSRENATDLWRRIVAYETGYYPSWIADCASNSLFYHGEQWTDTEREILKERGQYEIVINKIRKAMRGITGMVSSNIPKYRIVSSDEDDSIKVDIANKLIDWAWNNSGGVSCLRDAVKRAIVDNISYLFVNIDRSRKVKFDMLTYSEVVVDPASKHPLFDDAEMICIRKYLPIKTVQELYGIPETLNGTFHFNSFDQDIIDMTDALSAQKIALLNQVFSADKQYVKLYECYYKRYVREQNGDITVRINKDTVIGFEYIYKEELPPHIVDYPIVPLYSENVSNPYKRGEVHYVKDLQRFINKAYGVALLNAQTMSMPKTLIEEAMIPDGDISKFEQVNPNGIYVVTSLEHNAQIIQGQPINNAFFTLYMDAMKEFDNSTIPADVLNTTNTQVQRSDLLQSREMILDSFKDLLSVIDSATARLGYLVLAYVQSFLGKDKIIKIINAEKQIEAINTYRKEKLDVNDEESVQAFINYKKQSGVSEEDIQFMLDKAKEDVEYLESLDYVIDNLDFSAYDISIIPMSNTPTYKLALMNLMLDLAQAGAVDSTEVLKYAPIDDIKGIIARNDKIARYEAMINDLNDQVNELSSKLDSSDNKSKQLVMEIETTKHAANLSKIENDTRMKDRLRLKSQQLDTNYKNKEINELIKKLQKLVAELEAKDKLTPDVAETIDQLLFGN